MQQNVNCFYTACNNFGITISIKRAELRHQAALQKQYVKPIMTVKGDTLKVVKFTYVSSMLFWLVNNYNGVDTCIAKGSYMKGDALGWTPSWQAAVHLPVLAGLWMPHWKAKPFPHELPEKVVENHLAWQCPRYKGAMKHLHTTEANIR